MVQQTLAIVYCPLDSIAIDPKNPRVHSKRQVRQIARSIEAFGFNVPILIDGRKRLIAGHGRLLAARLLGMAQVPTITLENLSEPQFRMFMIADNRLTEQSVWDKRLLAEQFKALSVMDLSFSIDVTGFEVAEINTIIEGLAPATRGKHDPADRVPELDSKSHVTQPGDLWILDRHRLYCGDARKGASYSLLMQDRRAHAVFTDPPKKGPMDGDVTELEGIHHEEFPLVSGEKTEARFTAFLTEVLSLLARHSADGALHFVCTDWRHTPELLAAARHAYTEFKGLCVWVKDVASEDSIYRSQHELVFLFTSGRRTQHNNIQAGKYGRDRSNVWRYPCVHSQARINGENKLRELHATIKPVGLVADAILDCTGSGDILLDPFLGSGTTLIAAERTGRTCYGVDVDPRYVDVAVCRWQAFTGRNARQQSTNRTFDEIEETKNGRKE